MKVARNRVYFLMDLASDIIFKGALSSALIFMTYFNSKSDIGIYNVTASISVLIGAIFGGGWLQRITNHRFRNLSVSQAVYHIATIFTLLFIGLGATYMLVLSRIQLHSLVVIGLLLGLLNSFTVSLVEILTILLRNSEFKTNFIKSRLLLVCMMAFISFILVFTTKNILILFLAPILFNLGFLCVLINHVYPQKHQETLKKFLNGFNIVHLGQSLKIGLYTLLIMLTYVADNLIIAESLGIESLPPYSIAFSTIAFVVGVVSTTLQRFFGIDGIEKLTSLVLLKLLLVVSVFCVVSSLLLISPTIIWKNDLLSEAFLLSFYLYPYAVARILTVFYTMKIMNLGKPWFTACISILQVGITFSMFNLLQPDLELKAMPVAISISTVSMAICMSLYLSKFVRNRS